MKDRAAVARPITGSVDTAGSIIVDELNRALERNAMRPLVLGLSGAQGSGKSTLARLIANRLNAAGGRAASVSLDDFYYGRAERRRIAARQHPLFATRGPPGTHETALALDVLRAVKAGGATRAPTFDKGADERRPNAEWPLIPANLDVLIFEGWCIGARPEPAAALDAPMNMVESVFDRDRVWRFAVNEALGGGYQALFAEIDYLVYLRAPDFDVVRKWRIEPERALAAASPTPHPALMSADEIAFFVQHFERITRSMMVDLPDRADLALRLDERRRVVGVARKNS